MAHWQEPLQRSTERVPKWNCCKYGRSIVTGWDSVDWKHLGRRATWNSTHLKLKSSPGRFLLFAWGSISKKMNIFALVSIWVVVMGGANTNLSICLSGSINSTVSIPAYVGHQERKKNAYFQSCASLSSLATKNNSFRQSGPVPQPLLLHLLKDGKSFSSWPWAGKPAYSISAQVHSVPYFRAHSSGNSLVFIWKMHWDALTLVLVIILSLRPWVIWVRDWF